MKRLLLRLVRYNRMKKFFYNKILLIAIAAGLIASLVIAGQRHAVEIHNSQVDMAIDYESLKDLSEREGVEFSEILKKFKSAGITSLAIYDTTFEKLTRTGKVVAVYGTDIISNYHSGALTSQLWRDAVEMGAIDASRTYIIGGNLESYEAAKKELFLRFGEERVKAFAIGDIEVLEVKAQFGSFMKDPVGFDKDELETAKKFGFTIVARPKNFNKCTPEQVKSVFEKLEGYPISEIVFDGPEILGAENHVDITAAEMKKRGYKLGLIEHTSQLQFYNQTGMFELAERLGYNEIARLYAIPKDEQPKLLIETAVQRWGTTDHERNIRINLLRTYEKPAPGLTLLETNLKYVRDTSELLKTKGFTFGLADTFDNYFPSKFLRVFVIIGVAAAAVLYLSLISYRVNANKKFQLILFAVLAIVAAVPILMGGGGKIRILAALMSANLFPALAVIWQLDKFRFARFKSFAQESEISTVQIIFAGIIALFVTSLLSMIGAAYLSGALSDVKYFLEFEIFRGIKLTFVLPLILVAVAFLQRFNILDEAQKNISAVEQLKAILNLNVTVKYLLAGVFVLLAFVVLIARSGHTSGMPVSGLEIKIRAMLEHMFYARPRSKEIFIGHPAFVMAIAAFLQKFPKSICFVLTIVATIGQSSMVETFAHMRTPIFMSFMRGVDGVLPGALIGAVLVLFLNFAASFKKEL